MSFITAEMCEKKLEGLLEAYEAASVEGPFLSDTEGGPSKTTTWRRFRGRYGSGTRCEARRWAGIRSRFSALIHIGEASSGHGLGHNQAGRQGHDGDLAS